MKNNDILNFSKYGIDAYEIGINTVAQLYIRVDKDRCWHKYNSTLYAGKCVSDDGSPHVSKTYSSYFGSGTKLPKKGNRQREKNGYTKMFEIANLSCVFSKKMLDKLEGWLITTIHDNMGKRCINRNKLHSESEDVSKEIEKEVKKLLIKNLKKEDKDFSDAEVERLMRNKKQRVYSWAKRHDYMDIRFAINNNMFSKTSWDCLDLMLYQSLCNKKIFEKAINDIVEFIGVNPFEKKDLLKIA